MAGRDTPPSVQDGPYGFEPGSVSNFDILERDDDGVLQNELAQKLGRETFDASTNWLNSGRRSRWSDSLRAFQNLHPSGSKYLSGDYKYRSTLFRPKTRIMVRRDEAATATAFFANEDVVSITANNDDDPKQQASAEILKSLLQFRLSQAEGKDRIPWFLTLVGARQDCDVLGICVGKVGWRYEERFLRSEERHLLGPDGAPIWDHEEEDFSKEDIDLYEKLADHPFIDLISPENFRFEPGCDWRDPVNTSPYLIELQPVYVQDALERMESRKGAKAEWKRVSTSALRGAVDREDDTTRRAREQGRVPGVDNDAWKPRDYDIAWTRIYALKWRGDDWYFRTLAGSGEILEPPRPLKEVYLHGERPYVCGYTNIETHKTYPASKTELVMDLQRAANQDWNSRFDAVMLNLMPRQFVREGSGQDVQDLRTFMPGKVVFVSGPKDQPLTNQVSWDRPPPVDGASFQEQDRIQLDWDDLAGVYNNASQAASQITQQSATGAHLLSGEAGGLNEYELRIFAETFVEPILRLLIKTEQAYETDEIILATAARNANLFQRFGIDKVTDELLNTGVTVRCNVGIGASNPALKLRNFATGAQILGSMFGQSAAMGANFQEVSKELFGILGYKDGARFFQPNFDPRVQMLQQEIQKLQGKQGGDGGAGKVQAAQIQAQSRIQERQIQAQADTNMAQLEYQTKQMAVQGENMRTQAKLQFDREKLSSEQQHDHVMANQEHAQTMHQQAAGFQQNAAMAHQQHAHSMHQQAAGFQQDQHAQQQANRHSLLMNDRQFQQGQAAAANDWMNDQATAFLNQKHEAGMAQQSQDHEARMAQDQQYHDATMAHGQQQHDRTIQSMQPRPAGPGGKPAPRPRVAAPAAAPPVHPAAQQAVNESAKARESLDAFTSAIAQLTQAIKAGHGELARTLGEQADRHAKASDAILQAVTKKKKVVRNAEGRIDGLE